MGAPPPLATLRHAGIQEPGRRRLLAAAATLFVAACARPGESANGQSGKVATVTPVEARGGNDKIYISPNPDLPLISSYDETIVEPNSDPRFAGSFRNKTSKYGYFDIGVGRRSNQFVTIEEFRDKHLLPSLKTDNIQPDSPVGNITAANGRHRGVEFTASKNPDNSGLVRTETYFIDGDGSLWSFVMRAEPAHHKEVYGHFKKLYTTFVLNDVRTPPKPVPAAKAEPPTPKPAEKPIPPADTQTFESVDLLYKMPVSPSWIHRFIDFSRANQLMVPPGLKTVFGDKFDMFVEPVPARPAGQPRAVPPTLGISSSPADSRLSLDGYARSVRDKLSTVGIVNEPTAEKIGPYDMRVMDGRIDDTAAFSNDPFPQKNGPTVVTRTYLFVGKNKLWRAAFWCEPAALINKGKHTASLLAQFTPL